ncbi:hypothetical protein Pfo_028936 [Paulownia fortunei]|nr:hypothetical protein Pfo_028936 [Paulownia fortunei]
MARLLVCCLILVNAHLILAIADSEEKQVIGEAPMPRKLGKHNLHSKITASSPSPSEEDSGAVAQEQVMKNNLRHHRSIDKSVAGGGVILGGLVTVFLVAVFCYIRATGRKNVEPGSPTDTSTGKRR